jgi:hypothetical protein
MPFSKAYEGEILETAVGRNPSAKRWVALAKKAPTKAETGKEFEENCEIKYKAYARVETEGTAWWKAFTGESPAAVANNKAIGFPKFEKGGAEETSKCTYCAILTAASGVATVVGYAALTAEVIVSEGNPEPSFAIGALEIQLT